MKYGEYLGCCVCGCKFIRDEGTPEIVGCPMCYSSVTLLSHIESKEVYEVLTAHGQFFPREKEG